MQSLMYWVQTAAIPRTTLDDKSKHIIRLRAQRPAAVAAMHKGDAPLDAFIFIF